MLESYFFYEIKRFDIKGREYLRTLGKFYIVDIGLRSYLLGFRNRDSGHALENVVYFELLRRGYDVAIGKVDNAEVDFIGFQQGIHIGLDRMGTGCSLSPPVFQKPLIGQSPPNGGHAGGL